jgi:anthranilate synthase/aminodeoxychorismate synthase-like glutamine amidotransferase
VNDRSVLPREDDEVASTREGIAEALGPPRARRVVARRATLPVPLRALVDALVPTDAPYALLEDTEDPRVGWSYLALDVELRVELAVGPRAPTRLGTSAAAPRSPRAVGFVIHRHATDGASTPVFEGAAPPLALLRALEATRAASGAPDALPFASGWVGVLGYGLAPTLDPALPASRHTFHGPDAVWLHPRVVIAEGPHGEAWISAVGVGADAAAAEADGAARAEATTRALDATVRATSGTGPRAPSRPRARGVGAASGRDAVALVPEVSPARYEARVDALRGAIARGDAFELCLTQATRVDGLDAAPRALHDALARVSPTRFAAVLETPGLALVSASPELYLEVDARGLARTRPMKGTRARHEAPLEDARAAAALASSPKDRAENLMIVDLARSDLGRVAAPGTVRASRLLEVERYRTVHQLVSTIQAELAEGHDVWDAFAATFPGGSMTGAPKLEAMRLLDGVEARARGPYAGALGWRDDRGAACLSMVIRSAYRARDGVWWTHAGGAVTWASRPADERAEMELKTTALCRAFATLGFEVTRASSGLDDEALAAPQGDRPSSPNPDDARAHAAQRPRADASTPSWRVAPRRGVAPEASIVIVDHDDSFTYNLVELLRGLGVEAQVVRALDVGLDALLARAPRAILLSPGPGDPRDPRRLGVSHALLEARRPELPILGVCLGHQAIVLASHGTIERAPPTHGVVEPILHRGEGLFAGLPRPLEGMRYHSLGARTAKLPSALVADAETRDGWSMAVRHRALPWWGLQFHPESVGTPLGARLVARFLDAIDARATTRRERGQPATR